MAPSLPPELLLQIITHIAAGEYESDFETLRNLCLSSKTILPLARAALYREVSVTILSKEEVEWDEDYEPEQIEPCDWDWETGECLTPDCTHEPFSDPDDPGRAWICVNAEMEELAVVKTLKSAAHLASLVTSLIVHYAYEECAKDWLMYPGQSGWWDPSLYCGERDGLISSFPVIMAPDTLLRCCPNINSLTITGSMEDPAEVPGLEVLREEASSLKLVELDVPDLGFNFDALEKLPSLKHLSIGCMDCFVDQGGLTFDWGPYLDGGAEMPFQLVSFEFGDGDDTQEVLDAISILLRGSSRALNHVSLACGPFVKVIPLLSEFSAIQHLELLCDPYSPSETMDALLKVPQITSLAVDSSMDYGNGRNFFDEVSLSHLPHQLEMIQLSGVGLSQEKVNELLQDRLVPSFVRSSRSGAIGRSARPRAGL